MNDLLIRLPPDSTEPVSLVCYHPTQIKNLLEGENVDPVCLANSYGYDSFLRETITALGWMGGTRSAVITKITRLMYAAKLFGQLFEILDSREKIADFLTDNPDIFTLLKEVL